MRWRETWRGRRDDDDDQEEAQQRALPEPKWEKYDMHETEVLPTEVLGWMLLRRSGLSVHARLEVLSATNNSLEFDKVENRESPERP